MVLSEGILLDAIRLFWRSRVALIRIPLYIQVVPIYQGGTGV